MQEEKEVPDCGARHKQKNNSWEIGRRAKSQET